MADDNPVNQEAIQRTLARRGYSVTLAGDGAQAVRLALTPDPARPGAPFDAVLMDVQMPEVDGFEATRRLRAALPPTPRLPIIALTANAMAGDRELCLDAGMDAYVTKPIQREQLFATLRQMLNIEPAPTPPTLPPTTSPPPRDASGPSAPATSVAGPGAGPGVIDPAEFDAAPAGGLAPGGVGSDVGAAPIIDEAALLENLEGDAGLLDDLLAAFGRGREAALAAIRRAIAQRDGPALDAAAHKFAGSLATFFATAAFQTAKALEALGESAAQRPDPRTFARAGVGYFELERRLLAFDEAIARLRERLSPTTERGS